MIVEEENAQAPNMVDNFMKDQDETKSKKSKRSSKSSDKSSEGRKSSKSKRSSKSEEKNKDKTTRRRSIKTLKKPKLMTIANKKLGKLTKLEKELFKSDWSEFKADVSMKNLINALDKSIKRRRRLYISDNPEETERINAYRKTYFRYKPLKLIALTLYILIPFIEKPEWCI